jgi:two-component system NtrC family sensor kinase
LTPSWTQTFAPGRETLAGRVALVGEVVHVPDITADPDWRLLEVATLGKIRTVLGVLLRRDGAVVGTLGVGRERVEPFTERQIELVRTFADQAVIAIENTRLLTELRESLEQQAATAEVLQVINSSPGELQPVFEAILEKAHTRCGATRGTLYLSDGDTLRGVAMNGYPQDWAEQARRGISVRESSLVAPLLAGARFSHTPDLLLIDDPVARASAERGGFRTMLLLPLRKDGALLGVITCGRSEVRPFSEKEIAFLENFGAQAVIAMDNARLLGELRERTRELEESLEYRTATSDVLKVISRSTFDLQPILDTVVETAQRLCDSDTAALSIREGDVFRFVATRSLDPAYDAAVRSRTFAPDSKTVTGRVALAGEAVHMPDITTDPDYRTTVPKLRTVLGLPLRRDGSVVGTLNLARERVAPFTKRQIELVRTFANQAVIAIENTRLLTELRESLEQQTATAEVLQVINSSPGELQPVFEAILEKAHTHCGATRGTLFLFDGATFRGVATHGFPQDLAEQLGRGFTVHEVSVVAPLLAGPPLSTLPICA